MHARENTFQGVALLEDNELLIGQLYRQYAAKFPRQVRLWSGLALDEMNHARMLRRLRSQLPAGKERRGGQRFDVGTLSTFRDFMKSLLYGTMEKGPVPQSALSTALYIQWSLMEQDLFCLYEEDPVELRTVLKSLAAGTCKQRDRLLKVLKKTRKASSAAWPGEASAGGDHGFVLPVPCQEFNHLGFFPLEV